jgi:hypothetical protein
MFVADYYIWQTIFLHQEIEILFARFLHSGKKVLSILNFQGKG